MSMFTSSIRAILKKYKPVVAQTVKETEGRDYVTSGDMLNFAVRSAFDKLRDSPLNRGPALAEQKRLSELQAAQRQADYIQRTGDLVNPGLNNPAQNISIRTLPQPGIRGSMPNNPAQNISIRTLPQPGIRGSMPNNPAQNTHIRALPQPGIRDSMPRVSIDPGYEEFIKNATSQFNQTNTGQQYQTALQALEAFKKANPSPGSYSGYGADPQLKAQYDQIYGNYQQAMIPYFQGLSDYQKEYKTQGMV